MRKSIPLVRFLIAVLIITVLAGIPTLARARTTPPGPPVFCPPPVDHSPEANAIEKAGARGPSKSPSDTPAERPATPPSGSSPPAATSRRAHS